MSCKNYIPKTFAHVAGLLALTAAGSQLETVEILRSTLNANGLFGKIVYLVVFVGLFAVLLFMKPGPFKYLYAIVLALFLGGTLHSLVKDLDQQDTLQKTLVQTVAVAMAMVILAFLEPSGKFIQFLPILFAGLVALLVVNLYYYFTEKSRPPILSTLGAGLFALFLAVDSQALRKAAATCKKPDYINESMNLYLDILNLFTNLGSD